MKICFLHPPVYYLQRKHEYCYFARGFVALGILSLCLQKRKCGWFFFLFLNNLTKIKANYTDITFY